VPSFVHTNSTILEKYKICITAKNIGELETLLSNSSKDEIGKLIDNTKVERFLNKYLDSHKDYEQIMQEYYEAVVDKKFVKYGVYASYEL
jgi:acyl CoA:acetate/3-ketoacid CoA transferase alpha subunit